MTRPGPTCPMRALRTVGRSGLEPSAASRHCPASRSRGATREAGQQPLLDQVQPQATGNRLRTDIGGQDHAEHLVDADHLEGVVDRAGAGLGGIPLPPTARTECPPHFEAGPVGGLGTVEADAADQLAGGTLLDRPMTGAAELPLTPPLRHAVPRVHTRVGRRQAERVTHLGLHEHVGIGVEIRFLHGAEDEPLGDQGRAGSHRIGLPPGEPGAVTRPPDGAWCRSSALS